MTDKERIAALETRITQLEFIINEIDGALCEYTNEVSDDWEPVERWNEGCKRAFDDLRKAYNLWHTGHNEVGDISMKFFRKHENASYVLRRVANGEFKNIDQAKIAANRVLGEQERQED